MIRIYRTFEELEKEGIRLEKGKEMPCADAPTGILLIEAFFDWRQNGRVVGKIIDGFG
jgi:hypothetical protein